MAKIQCRNFSDELFERLKAGAKYNERSIEGHVRFLLTDILINQLFFDEGKPIPVWMPEWIALSLDISAKQGFRSLKCEIIKRLTESLASDGIYPPGKE